MGAFGEPIRRCQARDCAALTSRRMPAANDFEVSRRTRGGTSTQHQARLEGLNDARTGMPHGIPRGAMCVQRFDDSLNSAIHTTYRISLRSSSMPEPRDPLLKVLIIDCFTQTNTANYKGFWGPLAGEPAEEHEGAHNQGWSKRAKQQRYRSQGCRELPQGFTVMILPQVHLRKPCYDFYFL